MYLLIVGADGTGKSTLSHSLSTKLRDKLRITAKTSHFNIWTRNRQVEPPNSEFMELYKFPVRTKIVQFIVTIIKFSLYSVHLRIIKRKEKCFIQERGWIDQALDPARYRLSTKFANVIGYLSRLLPQPDLVIALIGNPVDIASRKCEQTPLHVSEMNERIKKLNFSRIEYLDVTEFSAEKILDLSFDLVKETIANEFIHLSKTVLLPSRLKAIASSNSKSIENLVYRPSSSFGKVLRRLHILLSKQIHQDSLIADRLLFRYFLDHDLYPENWIIVSSSRKLRRLAVVQCVNGDSFFVKFSLGQDVGIRNELKILSYLEKIEQKIFEIPNVYIYEFTNTFDLLVFFADNRVSTLNPISSEKAFEIAEDIEKANLHHGDFAWWNIAYPNLVFDWENANFGANVSLDKKRFIESLSF